MTKKLFSLCLALILVLGCQPLSASAAGEEDWLTVPGIEGGQIKFDKANGVITDCEQTVTTATIPSAIDGVAVTAIDMGAFKDCIYLTSVTIPNSVTSIEYNTFCDCSGLTAVTIPDSVTSIRHCAFWGCSGLTAVTIPDSVTSIESSAFCGCSGLTAVTIPDSVTSIESSAFCGCSGLTSIQVSNENATYASEDGVLFNKNKSELLCCPEGKIGSYLIPDSVTSIGNSAFSDCSGLTAVTIPDSVTSIESSAFRGCSGLTAVTIPDSVTSIEYSAFRGCSGLTAVTIPDSVTSIGGDTFWDCVHLTTVTIPNSVTSIGSDAFYRCTSLTSIQVSNENATYASEDGVLFNKNKSELLRCPEGKSGSYLIPDSVANIDIHAFSDCASLISITIPNSVTSIGYDAFGRCTSLSSIQVSNENATYASEDGVLFNKDKSELLRCPEGKSGSYLIPDSVANIDSDAFLYCASLTSITIPNSVTSIGDQAFFGCAGLTKVTIPDSVTSIEFGTFGECTGLTSVIIPDSVAIVGSRAFSHCSSLTSIAIPGSVTNIGRSAFNSCAGLTNVTIPVSVTSIGDWAFVGCTGLKRAIFMGNAPTVGTGAFDETAEDFCIYYPDSGATGWTTPKWNGYPCRPVSELHPDKPTPPVTPPPSDDDPLVETDTTESGNLVTTTTQPNGDQELKVETPTGETIADIDLPANPGAGKKFDDVSTDSWYVDAVDKATAYGLFGGTSDTTFAPDNNMTRGMLAQVLYNLSGRTNYGLGEGTFTDVKNGAWYRDAVDWAAKVGVTSGTGNGGFSPNQSITREQLVTMLYNYARAIGMDTTESTSLNHFPDGEEVHDWAETAMEWAVAKVFINGREEGSKNYIAPQGTATRAEVAVILSKFVESLK